MQKVLTKKGAIDLTRKMWWELARTGYKSKFTVRTVDVEDLRNACFCCEYVELSGYNFSCLRCPIDFNVEYRGLCHCEHEDSPYSKWCISDTPKERQKWAKVMSQLPEYFN